MLLKHFIYLEYLRGMLYAYRQELAILFDVCMIFLYSLWWLFTFCRLEFDLAMKSNDLKRALHCLLTMSNNSDIGHDGTTGLGLNDILNLTDKKQDVDKKQDLVEGVQGIVKFAKEFLDLIDAADATAQGEIAREALKR